MLKICLVLNEGVMSLTSKR